jgi:uroporphyrinogen decarboxylase
MHKALRGEKSTRPPFWFMRQAGRYLPEYRELRAKAGGFLSLVYNPDWASEVTLQPIRRFDMDAAILFSDILVIPHAMGINVTFEAGEGPRLPPVRDKPSIEKLKTDIGGHLSPIMETLRKTRKELAEEKSLIGFCGAPWTVACYMVEGSGSRDFEQVRRFARTDKEIFALLIDKLVETSVAYLSMQIEAGADIVQIFDSWAGVLSEAEYKTWVIEPTRNMVAQLKKLHPEVPIIGFPRGSGAMLQNYAQETGVTAVSIDAQTPLAWVKNQIALPVQGNLDPVLLATDKAAAAAQAKHIIDSWRDKPFIFNLGHGILQTTPIENVQAVCDVIRGKA